MTMINQQMWGYCKIPPDSCQAGNVNSWAVDHWHRCRMIGWHITKSRLLKSSTPSKQMESWLMVTKTCPKKILPNSLHVWSKPTWRWTNKQHQAAHHQKNIWGPGPGQCLPKVAIIRTIWDSPIGTFGNCPENDPKSLNNHGYICHKSQLA